jgi:3-oxoacyl-[acyl-carrier protein] reductase
MSLQGKSALVTGAARGIGYAIAARLLRDGASVTLVDLDASAVERAAKTLGEGTQALVADVTRTAEVDRAVAGAHERWGRLDVVVNNAGITGGSRPIWELGDDDWHRVIACDLTSVFLVSRAAVKLMLGQGGGRIVNIASIAGKEGNANLIPYSSAKAGVIGLTKALAKEVATRGILVNAVAPALIGTELLGQMTQGHRRSVAHEDPDGAGGNAPGSCRARCLARVGRVLVLDGCRLRPVRRTREFLKSVGATAAPPDDPQRGHARVFQRDVVTELCRGTRRGGSGSSRPPCAGCTLGGPRRSSAR